MNKSNLTMNFLLEELYRNNWDTMINNVPDLKHSATNPLLIKVSEEYETSDVKIMLVGQETDNWYGKLGESNETVETLLSYYDQYFNEERGEKKRPFWNRNNFEYFETELAKYFSIEKKSVSFIWNNISKIGSVGAGQPKSDICKLERICFNVFPKEIEILKPDIIIFTTGKRDEYIKYHFGKDTTFIPLLSYGNKKLPNSSNLIAKLKLGKNPDICAIRVEHPNRRTMDKSIIVDILLDQWDNKNTSNT